MHALGARQFGSGGDVEAVLTFTRPLTATDLRALARTGVTIHTIESVGIDAAGDRSSAGAPYGPSVFDELAAFAMESSGTVLEGAVSATASVPNQNVFHDLVGDSRVFLVDVSPHMASLSANLSEAPSVNDVYWYWAGWKPLD